MYIFDQSYSLKYNNKISNTLFNLSIIVYLTNIGKIKI